MLSKKKKKILKNSKRKKNLKYTVVKQCSNIHWVV